MNFLSFAKRGAFVGTLLLGLSGARAQANIYVVTNTSDTNGTCTTDSCSLREAIKAANADTAFDRITFASDVRGAIELTRTDSDATLGASGLILSGRVEIRGPGADVLSVQRKADGPEFRIFLVNTGATAQMSGLTIRGGQTASGQMAGGISNRGNLTLTNSLITENISDTFGGGLVNVGTLTLDGCTVRANLTRGNDTSGGLDNNGPLTVVNSTFDGNSAPLGGGNTGSGGAIWTSVSATIRNSTLVGNGAGVGAGGIFVARGTVTVDNTIVADNDSAVPDVAVAEGGAFSSGGYNLVGNPGNVTTFSATGDKKGTAAKPLDPKLGPIQNNGGTTATYAPLAGSPVINAGNPNFDATTLPNDQRGAGYPRVSGGRLDIGAFEVQATPSRPVITNLSIVPVAPTTNSTLTAQVQANRSGLAYTFQWKKNKVSIAGATGPTLDLSVAGNGDKGDQISLTATASDAGGTSFIASSAPVTVGNTAPVVVKVTLSSNSPKTNDILSAIVTGSDVDNDSLTYTYQWKKNKVSISGATGRTLDLSKVGNGDVGDKISVTVVASDGTSSSFIAASPSATVVAGTGVSPSGASS